MKLHEIKDLDDDDEFPTANLKNLAKHVFHGRAWMNDSAADAALEAADGAKAGDGDVSLWHGWMGDSSTVYEISIASTSMAGVKRVLDAIKGKAPRAHLFTAHKSGMIDHGDWRDYK